MATMQLRYIEMFQAILQAGTLTGAATLLHISQPAATKLLQQAERRLGFPLFVRAKGRLHLTPESMMLKAHIERISDELQDLQRLASSIRGGGQQLLRVVSTPTLANAIVPRSIMCLRSGMAPLTMELSTQHSREMQRSIVLRESDVGLTLQPINHPDLNCTPLCEAPLMLIAPCGTWSPSECSQPIPIAAIAGRQMVAITSADLLGRQLQTVVEHLPEPPKVSTWVQTYQIAKELVAAGEGWAMVDPFTALADGTPVQARPIEPMFAVSLYVVRRVDGPINGVQQKFLDCVQQVVEQMINASPAHDAPGSSQACGSLTAMLSTA